MYQRSQYWGKSYIMQQSKYGNRSKLMENFKIDNYYYTYMRVFCIIKT